LVLPKAGTNAVIALDFQEIVSRETICLSLDIRFSLKPGKVLVGARSLFLMIQTRRIAFSEKSYYA
jgi:hypothetical protein